MDSGSTVTVACEDCGTEITYPLIPFGGTMLDASIRFCETCSEIRIRQDKLREIAPLIDKAMATLPERFDSTRATASHPATLKLIGNIAFRDKQLTTRSFYLYGPTRSGKTSSVIRLCEMLAKRHSPFRWFSCPMLQKMYSASLTSEGREHKEAIEDAIYSDSVVVLDDFLTGEWTARTYEFWYELFDTRLSRKFPTWITSNYSRDEAWSVIRKRVSCEVEASRLYSRIIELCEFVVTEA